MNSNQISKQKKANKSLQNFSNEAKSNDPRPEKTSPANITNVTESTLTIEQPLKVSAIRKTAVDYLKREHSSLSQVLKTVREHLNDREVQSYINVLKSVETNYAKKRFPVVLSEEDFTVPNFLPLYPFVTVGGSKKLCKIMKVTEANMQRVAISDGDFSSFNGEIIKNSGEKSAVLELKGVKYGLFEIQVFTVSDVLAKIVKSKKTGMYQSIRAKIEKEKAEKAAAKEAEKAAKIAAREAEKAAKEAAKEDTPSEAEAVQKVA